MIITEDKAFEKEIFDTYSDIAVPFELRQNSDGEIEITVYSFCKKIAAEFEKKFSSSPFSAEAREWLDWKVSPLMNERGYNTASALSHTMMCFGVPEDGVDKSAITDECELISSLDGEKWGELELDEFELDAEEETDRMAVIRREGKIVCYCGLNDITDNGVLEITVECEEAYRHRGFGKSCVAMLADYLDGLGMPVTYICAESNELSAKTARSAGLIQKETVMPYVCYLDDEDDEEDGEETDTE